LNNKYINFFISGLFILIIPALVSGPFLPDLFISILGIFIVFKIIYNRDYNLINNKISFFFLTFYILLIISSSFSIDPLFSFQSSLFYFRYLFFILSAYFLLNFNPKLDILFLIVALSSFLIISLDGFHEVLFGYNFFGTTKQLVNGRVSGLFGDELIIGSFLVRLSPLLLSIYLYNASNLKSSYKVFSILTFTLSSLLIMFSGERAAFLLLILLVIMLIIHYFIYFRLFIKSFLLLFIIFIFLSIPFFVDETGSRLKQDLDSHTSLDPNKNQYFSLYSTAFKMFKSKPLIGHGPKIFRIECKNSMYAVGNWPCSTHPHNTYLQLLSEVGLLGFLYVISLFLFFVYKIFSSINRKDSYMKSMAKYSMILSILINLWPLIPSGSFFNNWLCVFYFIPFGFYLYYDNFLSRKKI
tara:strand:+ start:2003 stop:3238 length:1236 start_codon:yes stop_codon:yes gene_type:complete